MFRDVLSLTEEVARLPTVANIVPSFKHVKSFRLNVKGKTSYVECTTQKPLIEYCQLLHAFDNIN